MYVYITVYIKVTDINDYFVNIYMHFLMNQKNKIENLIKMIFLILMK